jgi:hypothetical protein
MFQKAMLIREAYCKSSVKNKILRSNFYTPAVDIGCQMIVEIWGTESGYSFNEVFTLTGSTKAP